MSVEIEVKVCISGAKMGRLFWELDAVAQADFFTALANIAGEGAAIHWQMQSAAAATSDEGRSVMGIIGGSAYA